jgi:hypothetical protein
MAKQQIPKYATINHFEVLHLLTAVTRGQAMADKVQGRFIEFAYGLDLGLARQWGLYISTSKGKISIGLEEPALFS